MTLSVREFTENEELRLGGYTSSYMYDRTTKGIVYSLKNIVKVRRD